MNLRPTHTQIPDAYLDIAMGHLSPAEFKVLMAISRMTFGWQKAGDTISLKQLMEMTGLSNRGVLNSVDVLEKDKLIFVKRGDWEDHKSNYYQINLDWDGSMNSVHRDSMNSVHRERPSLNELSSPTKDSRRNRHKDNERATPANASNEAPKKVLDPTIKAIADKIYRIDSKKFEPLVKWIKAAERNYSTRVLVATLERFLPYAAKINGNWWPYLDKILDKTEGDLNASDHTQGAERDKRAEADWARDMFGGRGLRSS